MGTAAAISTAPGSVLSRDNIVRQAANMHDGKLSLLLPGVSSARA
jgi:hypothetical protein